MSLRHRSPKREKIYQERRPLVERMLRDRPWCEACPVFAGFDQKVTYTRRPGMDVHELVRRSQGGSILDEENLLVVCRSCHRRIGNKPFLAFSLGLAIPGEHAPEMFEEAARVRESWAAGKPAQTWYSENYDKGLTV